ncbi:MAG: peptidoglycan DD-metalloendopeptidase family protein [Candidatus Merdivicinus sp.]
MKKLSFGKSKGASKGFYIALAVSVVAVGTVTYLTLSRLNQVPEGEPSQSNTLENNTEWSIPETSSIGRSEPGVPKDTPTVTPESSEDPVQELPSSSTAESSSPTVKPNNSSSNSSGAGAFMMPVSGDILNPFSNGELVKSKTLKEWRTHDGIDIKAAEGTPVKSLHDGKVTDIREDPKWGVTIEIEYPDGITAIFSGLASDVKVKKGQQVKMGDVIGAVGNTSIVEASEEMHLHLGMKKDGEWIDPMSVIVKG